MRILFVEDDARIRESYKDLLEHVGHQVTATGSGSRAIELLREMSFDAVVTDFNLEDAVHGHDVAKVAKERGVRRVILTSGSRQFKGMADVFLHKGLDGPKEMLKALTGE